MATKRTTKPRRAASKATGTAKAAAAKGSDRVGRGTRWTEEQVRLLLDTVTASSTAKEAFETVAKQLGKSAGTVQQKYYNLQKQAGGNAPRRRGRPAGRSASARPATSATRTGAMPDAATLRGLTVDELVGLATRVKAEVDRRRRELDAASKLFG